MLVRAALIGAGLGLGCSRAPQRPEPLRVAAASDLAGALPEIASSYESRTGQKLKMAFGSTGLLSRQIVEGAPFDVFLAADVAYADDTIRAGACAGDTKQIYARGRLALVVPAGRTAPKQLQELAAPEWSKIAIANPDHAPYGRAAREALRRAGVWERLAKRLIFAENVRQAHQLAQTGNADASLVALSLVIGTSSSFSEVDPTLHAPLDQALVGCGRWGPSAAARAFARFLQSEEARAILRRHGFLLPGEALPPR